MVSWPQFLPPVLTGTGIATSFNLYDGAETSTHSVADYREGYVRDVYQVSFIMLLDEYGLFQAFWKEKIGYGMDWFTLRIPTDAGNVLRTVRIVKGEYNATMSDEWMWNVSFNVEVHPYA